MFMPETPEEKRTLDYYYRTHYRLLHLIAWKILGDHHLADDATQEAFLVAYRNASKCLGCPNPVGWLIQTVKNTSLHILRDRAQMSQFFTAMENAPEPATEMDLISNIDIESDEDLKLLHQIYVKGYSITEMAEKLGMKPAALSSKLYRIKKRLREDPWLRELWESL